MHSPIGLHLADEVVLGEGRPLGGDPVDCAASSVSGGTAPYFLKTPSIVSPVEVISCALLVPTWVRKNVYDTVP